MQFINSMHVRDPRVWPLFLAGKPQHVRDVIWAWNSLPGEDDDFWFEHLGVHTDGSAILSSGWPAIPISAGWGAVFFAVTPDGTRRLLGAMWGPASVQRHSP